MLSALCSLALAGPIFLSATDAVQLDVNGNWPRAFPTEGGWHVFNATQGEYHYQYVYDDLTTDRTSRRDLTGHTDLQDHSIALCPDGTWFHAASASHVEDNDSAYVFRYDADLNLVSETVIADGETGDMYADLPAVCGETFRGVGYWPESEQRSFRYIEIDAAGNEVDRHDLADSPSALGSSLFEDEGQLYAIGFYAKTEGALLVSRYDTQLASLGYVEVDITADPWTGYWSQGVMRVGDTYLVAHMAEDSRYDWGTQGGDLWVTAFDLDWNVLDTMQLSHNTAPDGGMQPAFAIKDDQLLVLYTYELYNWAYTVTLDLEATGGGGDDTGGDDTGGGDTGGGDTGDTGADTGDTGPDDTGAPDDTGVDTGDTGADDPGIVGVPPTMKCGCTTGGGAGVGLVLPALAALAARRRRRA